MKKTVLITAGGTGGHIFPALAIAKELSLDYEVIWVGGIVGLEHEIVPKNGFPLLTLSMRGVRKKGLKKLLTTPFMLLIALVQSLKIIVTKHPDIIVGFGGYATFPLCFMGWLLRIPTVIHEQNSYPGLVNKLLSHLVTRTLTAFPDVLLRAKPQTVGNPIRDEIANLPGPEVNYAKHKGKLNVLILGGSLGARAFNEQLPQLFAVVSNVGSIIHQVGRGSVEDVEKVYSQHKLANIKVVNFIENMADAYVNADLIICRSGASTVSEVCSVGIAAIFIPYPYAVDDHQTYNAMPVVNAGGALLIQQSQLDVKSLATIINQLDREKCLAMAKKAKSLGICGSTSQIVTVINSLLKN